LEHQVAFVIAETDIVTRVKFLDELAFKQERLGFAADDVIIEIANALDERAEFQVPAQAAGGLEILAHALAQIAGFADVNDRSETVFHQVNARLMRQGAEFFANDIRHWHERNFSAKMRGRKENFSAITVIIR